MHGFDFRHHLLINSEATSRIHYDDVGESFFCLGNGCIGNINRLLFGRTGEEHGTYLARQRFKLLDCRWAIYVGRDHHDLFLFTLNQIA